MNNPVSPPGPASPIQISDLPLEKVIFRLYHATKTVRHSHIHDSPTFSEKDAAGEINYRRDRFVRKRPEGFRPELNTLLHFHFVCGRPFQFNVLEYKNGVVTIDDPGAYDQTAGAGTCRKVIDALRQELRDNADKITPKPESTRGPDRQPG